MKNLWTEDEANKYKTPLELRVYTSRLLGMETELVLHGGGNTSVKDKEKDIFGVEHDILYVKGSGWDLATIEKEGFAPVKMEILMELAKLEKLSDKEMVKYQKQGMTDSNAPNPSVEAILHAIIPFKYVDHTHADTVVAITNTENGNKKIQEIYGDRVLSIPYIMPGFILARKVYEIIQNLDLNKYEAIILLNHGVFTYSDSAKESYEKMIKIITIAEDYLKEKSIILPEKQVNGSIDTLQIAKIRKEVSNIKKEAMLAKVSLKNSSFAKLKNVASIATRGPLTPDHVIRTKKDAVIINNANSIVEYSNQYKEYFARNNTGKLTCLDSAPRWGVLKDIGTISFGSNFQDLVIIEDIIDHTVNAIQVAEMLGGYKALPEKDIFEMEYWELEQAKLKKVSNKPAFLGKIALVSGGASGIGRACVEELSKRGACVVAIDINPDIEKMYNNKNVLGVRCNINNEDEIIRAIHKTIESFGGLDILVSNAGIFPETMKVENMDYSIWDKSIEINMTSHMKLIKNSTPYLRWGIDPSVVIIASKNVPAPGVGASAYSAAKAGLTQIARILAMELAPDIRVNTVHPDAVFDTGIWNEEVLEKRAQNYGLTVEEYKKRNLLKVEISSQDVARLVCEMSGDLFRKITGVQLPIDGGNDRVI